MKDFTKEEAAFPPIDPAGSKTSTQKDLMTTNQPRAPRPSAIRRRPQPVPSVDDFIQAGTGLETVTVVEAPPVSETEIPSLAVPEIEAAPKYDVPPPSKGEGKTYVAIFLGMCAFGVSLFSAYHSWQPLDNAQPGVQSEITPQQNAHVEVTSLPISNEIPSAQLPTGSQGVQWLALTDLQFARHDLSLGLNTSARDALILAKIHMSLLGEAFAAENTALDQIISQIENAPVLSLDQLDRDMETLKATWLRVNFTKTTSNLLDWLIPWNRHRQDGYTELETTDEGRYLVARLDRIKWLALWGDESGLRQASTNLETYLGKQFLDSVDAKEWLLWLRGLQRIPLRHDVTEINTLIVRLSRLELPP